MRDDSNPYLDAAAPFLLPSLLSPSSPHAWRRGLVEVPTPSLNATGALFSFSLLPRIQAAAAASSLSEEKREEEEELRDGYLPSAGESEQHADADDPSPHALRGDGEHQRASISRTEAESHAFPNQDTTEPTETAKPRDSDGDTTRSELPAMTPKQRGRPGEKFRDEYKPSDYTVDSVDLRFLLEETNTKVSHF